MTKKKIATDEHHVFHGMFFLLVYPKDPPGPVSPNNNMISPRRSMENVIVTKVVRVKKKKNTLQQIKQT